jgi:hypothetical protein
MMSAWKCGNCGAMNQEDLIRCRLCFGTLVESVDVLPWTDASSPVGARTRVDPEFDPETDPTCLGTKAYLDGVMSGLSGRERVAYYDWLAAEVKRRCDANNDDLASTGRGE